MKISILTVAPEMFEGFLKDHVIERAQSLKQLELEIIDIRDYAPGSFRAVDDSPYGGGAGMILRAGPVVEAVRAVKTDETAALTVVLTPAGKVYDQKRAMDLSACSHLILVCGHYEGIDARVMPHADLLLSVGDYILSGGEVAAMAVADSVARLLPGVIRPESLKEESFTDGLLEYPQYTRPVVFEGERVPDVLLSGDHEAVRRWREEESRKLTGKARPDLIKKAEDASAGNADPGKKGEGADETVYRD